MGVAKPDMNTLIASKFQPQNKNKEQDRYIYNAVKFGKDKRWE